MKTYKWDDIKRPRKEESMEEQKINKGKDLIGKTLEEAKKINPQVRVSRRDGENLVVTSDFRPTRPNVEVEKGVITKVLSFG